MRPLKLTIQAFGSYAKIEIIDFTKLKNKNIFLVTGATGAGKTTIFDAIAFALYGEASGNDRVSKSLRSDFANKNLLTLVEYEFLYRGKKYYVKREPEQWKKKLRGEGDTKHNTYAEFKKISGDLDIIIGSAAVTTKIENLTGINAKQFKQIAMIAQGEFKKVLYSESKEREKILQKLFNTTKYNKINELLTEDKKKLDAEIKDLNTEIKLNLRNAKYSEASGVIDILRNKDLNILEIIEFLKNDIKTDKEEFEILKSNEKLLSKELEKINKKSEEIFQNNKKIENMGNMIKEKEELENQKIIIENKEKLLEKINNGIILKPYRDNYKNELKNKLEIKREIKNISKLILENINNIKFKVKELNNEETLEKKLYRKKLNKNFIILEENKEKVSKINEFDELIQDNEKLKLNKEEYLKSLYSTKNVLQKEINVLENLQEKVSEKLIYEPVIENFNEIPNAFKQYEISGTKYKTKNKELEQKETYWFKSQAFILAKDLEEGMACPVCGSKVHVKLATVEKTPPTELEINKLKEIVEKLKSSFDEKKVKLDDYKEKYIIQKKEIENLHSIEIAGELIEFKQYILDINNKLLNEIRNYYSKLSENIKNKMKNEEGQDKKITNNTIKKILKMQNDSFNNNEIEIKKTEKDIANFVTQISIYNTKIDGIKEILRNISFEFKDLNHYEEKLQNTKDELETLDNKLERLKLKISDFKIVDTKLNTNLGNKESQLVNINGNIQKLKKELFNQIKINKILNYRESLYSLKKQDQIEKLKGDVNKYKLNLNTIKTNLEKTKQECINIKYQDISFVLENIDEKELEYKEFFGIMKEKEIKIKDNGNSLKIVNKNKIKLEELEKRASIENHITDIASGKNNQQISFERYILASFLEDILYETNKRLTKMTGNRYKLRRKANVDGVHGSHQSGLEMEILDEWKGTFRDVKTLSGGESFKASLSMALGLADVVSNYSGGVVLDTIFIDEGFGTLDPESLDEAIKCLIELQQDGRLVGIISHVSELKEKISTRLEVMTSSDGGSYTRFNV